MYIVLWKVLELPLTYSKYFKALFRGLRFMTCHGDCGKKSSVGHGIVFFLSNHIYHSYI